MDAPLDHEPLRDGKTSEIRSLSRHEQDEAVARIAAHQDALITLLQARAVGLTEWAVRRRVATGRWDQLLPGVHKIVGAPTTDRQRVRAAQLWAGGAAVVSHRSAGWLWGLDAMGPPSSPEVTVPRRHGPNSEFVVVHRSHILPDVDRAEISGIPCTSAARSVIDIAGIVDEETLEIVMESGFRLGLYRESFLRWRLSALGGSGRRGSGRLLTLLDERGKGAAALEYPLEVKTWRLLKRSVRLRHGRGLRAPAGSRRRTPPAHRCGSLCSPQRPAA
jgi:hypothetical protein